MCRVKLTDGSTVKIKANLDQVWDKILKADVGEVEWLHSVRIITFLGIPIKRTKIILNAHQIVKVY